MMKQFSLFDIENRLQSLVEFLGCNGVVLQWRNHIYSYPVGLKDSMGRPSESYPEFTTTENHLNTKSVTFQDGQLVFLGVPSSVEYRTLEFLCKNMEKEIELASTFNNICEASVAISSDLNLNPVLNRVMSLTEEMLNIEVSAVMLLDHEKGELYWEISRGEKSEFFLDKVTLPVGEGIAGYVAQTGESMIVNDVKSEPRWCSSFDEESGFRTRSLMCVPVKFHGKLLGVIEAINKRDGDFTASDLRILEILATQAGTAIENARIHEELGKAYDELQVMDKAKERVISHLSHELRTPLSIILTVFKKLTSELRRGRTEKLDKAIQRGIRNVDRLLDLHAKVDDIINHRSVEEYKRLMPVIEQLWSVVEELREENKDKDIEAVYEKVCERFESLFNIQEGQIEKISLEKFLNDLCDEAVSSSAGRDLEITRHLDRGIFLRMDRNVLKKICGGLLRNAIENTPDEGKIEVHSGYNNGEIRINVRDYGVGITPENQKLIFGGFFHTQDTELYSTKSSYDFNAGGSGCDLLRAKMLSERHHFHVDFESTRCPYLPGDKDRCPGKVSLCSFIKDRSECLSSGGSNFSIRLPLNIFEVRPN